MLLLTKYTVLYKENEICCIILLSLPSRERGLKSIITHYGKFKIDKLSNTPVITCDLNKCPSFAVCSSKEMNVEMVMKIAYCPICGRKLVQR